MEKRRIDMNCPYCTREMENGYLRGNNSYELL